MKKNNNTKLEKSKEQKKEKRKNIIVLITFFTVCLLLGFFLGMFLAKSSITNNTDGSKYTTFNLLKMFIYFISLYLVMTYIQIILHELGHLVFGLLTGYTFVSFRIGSFLLKRDKEKGKIIINKFKVPGTAGQCLMLPPNLTNKKKPYVLYNMGGAFMNFTSAMLGILVAILLINHNAPNSLLFSLTLFIFVGVFIGLTNAIPLKIGVPNDGYNVWSISRDKDALKSLYYQLVINAKLTDGIDIKELDIEDFRLGADVDLTNPLNTSILLLEHYYYLSFHDYDKSRDTLARLIPYEHKLCTLFKNELKIERTFLELMGDCDKELIDELFTQKTKKYLQKLKVLIDKQRVLMAYEALYNKDLDKAMSIYESMKNNANKFPIRGAVSTELSLGNDVIKKYNDRIDGSSLS